MASCVSLTTKMLASLVVSGRVTYHNEENGFCVLRIKARGHRELVTVIGHAAVIPAGEWATASGEWINDRTHARSIRRWRVQERAALRATACRHVKSCHARKPWRRRVLTQLVKARLE